MGMKSISDFGNVRFPASVVPTIRVVWRSITACHSQFQLVRKVRLAQSARPMFLRSPVANPAPTTSAPARH